MIARSLVPHGRLVAQLARREIAGRYRGSSLGILWSMITPLLMLTVYTLVFGTVFRARWGDAGTASTAAFAIILFTGLIVFQLFADVVTRAPGLVLANQNFVKKIVFPLQILPPVTLLSAVFHAAVSFAVLIVFMLLVNGSIPLTALWLPIVLAPFCLLILGLGWLLASLGVFLRDINQFLGTLVTALMFLSPIFYPLSALPEWLRPWIALNPIAFPVEQTRAVLVFGHPPDLGGLTLYALFAAVIGFAGYFWFQRTRKGFADVL